MFTKTLVSAKIKKNNCITVSLSSQRTLCIQQTAESFRGAFSKVAMLEKLANKLFLVAGPS